MGYEVIYKYHERNSEGSGYDASEVKEIKGLRRFTTGKIGVSHCHPDGSSRHLGSGCGSI